MAMADTRKGAHLTDAARPMTSEEKTVIFASSLGTVFEWYDFYLFGVMAAIIAANFFTALDPATRDIFTLLAFAAGFAVRPFGAIVFGRLGDLVGRKYTFLVTILIMGISTFLVGLLPTYEQIGWAGLAERLKDEAPRYAKLLPELPRLLHAWLQARPESPALLALLEEQRRANKLLLALLLGVVGFVVGTALFTLVLRWHLY